MARLYVESIPTAKQLEARQRFLQKLGRLRSKKPNFEAFFSLHGRNVASG